MSGNVLYHLIFSLIYGFTEFLGVDATAHHRLLLLLSGSRQVDLYVPVMLRTGLLIALVISSWPRLRRLLREQSYATHSRRLKRPPDPIAKLDLKLIRLALLPILAGIALYTKTSKLNYGFWSMTVVLFLNACVLFIPRVINSGNKDGRSASPVDSLLLGFGGFLGFIPGFSRIGGMISAGSVAGLERGYCLDMALILSIPAMLGLLILDLIALIAAKTVISLAVVAAGLLYAFAAFAGGMLSIVMMRYLSIKIGFTGFAYYSFGLALLAFVFYLVV